MIDKADYCYECQAYGDNFEEDENGELICLCGKCQRNPFIGGEE